MKMEYRVCTRCVMDTSDPEIIFDEQGVCNHCHQFDTLPGRVWFPNEEGRKRLAGIVEKIRKEGQDKKYDSILGLSGGLDSSYLALVMKDYGLRPLVMHVDAGWNTEASIRNIQQIIEYCDFDLHTHVMDWDEIKDLQVAFLKSGVSNQDTAQDHAFFATLYHFAVKNKIRYVISGGNLATEAVSPASWHHSAMDAIQLNDIYRRFVNKKLKNFKTISPFQYYIFYPFLYRMRTIRPLNYIPYNKQDALVFLKNEIGYKEYGRKHGESLFTKFFQNHYLPVKFGMDKRRPHLSSLILSGQISRSEAVAELEKPLYEQKELAEDMEQISKKLGLTIDELNAFINSPGKPHTAYKNWDNFHRLVKTAQSFVEKLSGKTIRNYS